MTHIARLTDYGVVLLSCLAREPRGAVLTAPELAGRSRLPAATASKLCRQLAVAGLLVSHRGARGGYALARSPAEITVAEVIAALQGPVHLTDCGTGNPDDCGRHQICSLRSNWQRVNTVVREALHRLTLADMVVPLSEERLGALITEGRAT